MGVGLLNTTIPNYTCYLLDSRHVSDCRDRRRPNSSQCTERPLCACSVKGRHTAHISSQYRSSFSSARPCNCWDLISMWLVAPQPGHCLFCVPQNLGVDLCSVTQLSDPNWGSRITCCPYLPRVFNRTVIKGFQSQSRSLTLKSTRSSGKNYSSTFPSLHIEYLIQQGPHGKHHFQYFFYCFVCTCCRGNVFTEPLPSNGRPFWLHYSGLLGEGKHSKVSS
jgi:hypothetical protein